MTENEIAKVIVDATYKVHTSLGPGLLESVYETVLDYELKSRGLNSKRQVPLPVHYGNLKIDDGYRADLIVEKLVIIELKSVEQLNPVHFKQTLSYLKLSGMRLGLLINFNVPIIRNGINRIVNGLPD